MNAKKNMKDSAQREAFYSLFFATCESSAERALQEFESKWILSKSTEDDSAEIEESKKFPRWWKGTCHSLSAMKSAWIMGFMNMRIFSGFMTGTNRSEAFHSVVQSEGFRLIIEFPSLLLRIDTTFRRNHAESLGEKLNVTGLVLPARLKEGYFLRSLLRERCAIKTTSSSKISILFYVSMSLRVSD